MAKTTVTNREKLELQEQLRAKRDLLKLELDIVSASSKLSKVEGDVLKNLKQQEIYGLMRKSIRLKDVDTRQRMLGMEKQLVSDEKNVAKLAAETLGYKKKQIPFMEEIESIEERQRELQADIATKLKGPSNAQKHEKAALETQLLRYRKLSDEKIKWDEIAEIQESSLNMFGLSIEKVKDFGAQIDKMMMSPMLAIIGLFTLAIAKFIKLDAAAESFRESTGLTKRQTKAISDDVTSIYENYKGLGVTIESTYTAAAALFKTQENLHFVSKDNVETVALLARNFGIAEENSAGFIREMKAATNFTDDKIQSIVGGLLEVSHEAGVSAAAVMQDIADVSEEGYAFLSKYPTKFIETAVRARQLGISMTTLNNTTKTLLDFETSIGDEMEASVLTGRNLNLNAARYYALQGNQEKVLEEILKNTGSVAEFNKMNILQQQAIAKAVGMETKDLAVLLKNKEIQHKLQIGIVDAETKAWKQEEEIRGTVTKLKDAWSSIVSSVSSIFLPVIETVAPILASIGSVVAAIADSFGGIGKYVLMIVAGLMVISRINWMGNLKSMGTWMMDTIKFTKARGLGKVGGGAADLLGNKPGAAAPRPGGSMFEGLGKFMKDIKPSAMLAGGAAMIMVAGAVWILAKAMQEFSTGVTWDGVLKGIVAMGALVGAVAVLGAIMMSGVGAVAILAGAAAILVIASSMYVLGEAMKLISENGDGALSFLGGLGSIDALHVAAIAGSLLLLGQGMTAAAVGATILGGVGAMFGGGGGGEKKGTVDKMDMLMDAVDKVTAAIEHKNFDVYLDGRKVSKELALANNYK